jgi:hypothetical protein
LGYVKMDEPHSINFHRERAPRYCTHCAASNRAQLATAQDPKMPLCFVIDGHAQRRPGMPCRTYVYKTGADRRAVDPALFAQVGLTAPSAAAGVTEATDSAQPRLSYPSL